MPYPWVRQPGKTAEASCLPVMSRPSRRRTCSITTTCCSTGRRWSAIAELAEDIGNRLRPCAGRRISGYQQAAGLGPDGAEARRRGLTVVGDDAQSIYSFRAATVRNILDFPPPSARRRHHHARPQLPLDEPILAAANAVIDLARERFTKNLWTERQSERAAALVTVRTRRIRRTSSSSRCSPTARKA
jgi:hypothetical protein